MKQSFSSNGISPAAITRRSGFLTLLVAAAGLLTLSISPAMAQTQTRVFPIRTGTAPFDIVQGPDGNFWFTLANSSKVAVITPRGQIHGFRTPSLTNPAFITVGPDGNMWFGEGSSGSIASVTPTGVVTEHQFSFFGVSVGITTGSDGNIWFSDQTDHAIWRYNLATDTFTEFKTPTPNSYPGDMTLGSDGNVWFVESAVNKFGRITPSGQITEFTGIDSPGSIAAGPDGNLWIASAFTPTISKVTVTGQITSFATPHTPTIIRPGNGSKLIFTSFTGNTIASISTGGAVTESAPFPDSAPEGITAGRKNQVWFLGDGTNSVYQTVFPQ